MIMTNDLVHYYHFISKKLYLLTLQYNMKKCHGPNRGMDVCIYNSVLTYFRITILHSMQQ